MAYLYLLVVRIPVIFATSPGVGDTIWYNDTVCPGLVTWRGLCGVFLERSRHGLQVDLAYMYATHMGVVTLFELLGDNAQL